MIEFFFAALRLALLGLVLFGCLWVIRRLHTDDDSSIVLQLLVVAAGLVLGVGLCFLPYRPRPDLAVYGAPLPLAILQREGDRWVDYVSGPAGMILIGIMNILLVSATIHALALASLVVKRKRRKAAAAQAS